MEKEITQSDLTEKKIFSFADFDVVLGLRSTNIKQANISKIKVGEVHVVL